MNIMTITDIMTGVFESITIVVLINSFKDADRKITIIKHILLVLLLTIMINLSNQYAGKELLNLVFIMASIFIISFMYSRNIKNNVIVSVVSVLILTISEMIVLFSVTVITGITVEQATEINSYRMIGILLSKLFAFIVIKILCINHKRSDITVKNSYWLLFFSISMISMLAIFLIFKLQYESSNMESYNISVLCSIGLMYSTFFTLYLYEHIIRQANAEQKESIYRQQIKEQSKHIDEILIAQKQLKMFRHDFANHMISLKAYFENKDNIKGIEYLENISDVYNNKNNLIDTGNIAFDAIINAKKSIAESNDIEFSYKIQIPENLFVDAKDMCIIFGNALDNCIEACKILKNQNKKITLSVIYEDDSVICKIVNTCSKDIVFSGSTTKKNKSDHGFGLENIKSALSNYEHILKYEKNDGEFLMSFIIFKD